MQGQLPTMSFHPSSTPTGSSGGELKYTLQVRGRLILYFALACRLVVIIRVPILVRRAELIEALKKSVLYVEIVLPKGLQVLTQTVESSKLEWNRRFDLRVSRVMSNILDP